MELELVDWLRSRIPPHPALIIPPGDDAAVLAIGAGQQLVATTDMLMDGVDFRLTEHDPRVIGRKCLAVNLSDLAAMAARPLAALVAVALPRSWPLDQVQAFTEGVLELAAQHEVALAGGDTNVWEGPLCVSVTALGEVAQGRAWRRAGAQIGDALVVTGPLGGSILGRHFTFEPRTRAALAIAERYEVHAAMDLSDGLLLDLSRLLRESRCGAELDLHRIPISPSAVELAARDGVSPLDHALSDGEDFELLLSLGQHDAERLIGDPVPGIHSTIIGRVTAGTGMVGRDVQGCLAHLPPRGYVH
jgi:thiamine-monophosphate kinase